MQVVVLGAGALGTAAALHLQQAGHEVTVLERIQVAGATTGLAAGILSLALVDENDRWLTRRTIEAIDALDAAHPREGADTGPILHRPGSHLLVAPGTESDVVSRITRGLAKMDVAHEVLDPDDWVKEMERRGLEAVPDGLDHVLSLPGDAWALSTEATTHMARVARLHGAVFRSAAAERLVVEAGRVVGVRDSMGKTHRSDAVVVALGAWSRGFLASHDLRLPARGYRTHAAILRTPLAANVPIIHDNAGCYYLRPESPSHLLVGDGTDTSPITPDGFTNDAESYFIDGVSARMPRRFPGLGAAQLQNAWRGILTGIPDKRPLVGPHPDVAGLWLCTGGNGFGFMRSHALGACLAASVTGERPQGLPSGILEWMDPVRFWPDPPQDFPVMEGFQLMPPSHDDGMHGDM